MINKPNKRKFMEVLRECGKRIWLLETNQEVPYNEKEINILKTIEENILDYLETYLSSSSLLRNYNSIDGIINT